MEEEWYITPIQVRDFIFCPTIFYYKYLVGIMEPKTEVMDEGLREFSKDLERWQERKTLLNQRRIHVDKMLFGYPITCRRYRLRGIVDTIYWSNNRLNVLEIKSSGSTKLYPDHLYQTAVYGLMVEEEFKQTVYKLIIFYKKSNKWFEKRFTNQLREYIEKTIEKVHRTLESGEVPEHRWGKKCVSCFYNKFCY